MEVEVDWDDQFVIEVPEDNSIVEIFMYTGNAGGGDSRFRVNNITIKYFENNLLNIVGGSWDTTLILQQGDDLNFTQDQNPTGAPYMFFNVDLTMSYNNIGLEENTNSINVYPNPTSDYIKIHNNNLINLNYKLINLNGQIVYEGIMNDKLNIEDIENGVYIFHLNYGNEVLTRKIIKQ
jgi:hypothetical protein